MANVTWPLGRTGEQVSIIGVGGYHLGTLPSAEDATRLVHEAVDAGVNFFDNAWEYQDGRSEEWLGRALAGRRDKVLVMTQVCTHGRGKQTAMEQLEQSLTRLRTDHLDVWQIHEVIYENDPDLHFAPDGVVAALDEAKRQPILHGVVTAEEALRYAMSLPVATTITGIDSFEVLRQNLAMARAFTPMHASDMQTLRERCAAYAADGHLELYTSTKRYDGAVGRAQHGYLPSQPHQLSVWLGTALIAVGVTVNLFAARRHTRVVAELNRARFDADRSSRQAVVLAVFLALVGVAMAIYVTVR